MPENLRDAVEEGLLLPEYFSPIRSFFMTRGGNVWLHDPAVPVGDGAKWVVLGPDGAVTFQVLAPPGITFMAAQEDRVWGTGVTELDVPFIVLYRLVEVGACGA